MRTIAIFYIILIFSVSCNTTKKRTPAEIRKDDSISKVISDSINAMVAEKIRIAKENDFGVWQTGFYVDDFGEPTKKGYISNVPSFLGKFSNSATENADLTVRFLVSGPSDISIQLYEYAGKNPVKKGIEEGYKIKVKQDSIPPVILNANNYDDRLYINKQDSKKLNDMLIKGGNFKFSIVEISKYSSSSYFFEIPNATGYSKAMLKLQSKK